MLRLFGLLSLVSLGAAAAYACGGYGAACREPGVEILDQEVVTLRAAGPEGLLSALERYDAASDAGEAERLKQLVDQVAGQRDATVSRLFWYTDLEQAKLAAAESGRPILSLRMLGKLTDEYSCANSRFFRTALYANEKVSDYLRSNYILHWESIRPVPRVTVDFGDGRKLERTLTGNSAHYVLDATGRPLDVLPGLYGPQAFQNWLQRSYDLAYLYAEISSKMAPESLLKEYHANRLYVIGEQLRHDLAEAGSQPLDPRANAAAPQASAAESPQRYPSALEAGRVAVCKSLNETQIAASFVSTGETLAQQDDRFWQTAAARHADKSKLDERSVNLMRSKVPREIAQAAMRAAYSKRAVENPLLKIVHNFENSMAIDSVRNEYLLHRTIHAWFVDGTAPQEVSLLNERVYTELFLTPSSDPWLGLTAGDAYAALDGGGLTEPQAAK